MNKFDDKEDWENISWISSSSHSSLNEGELIEETNSKLNFSKNQYRASSRRSATDQSVEVSSAKRIKNSKTTKNKSHKPTKSTKDHNPHSKTHVKKQHTNMKKKKKKQIHVKIKTKLKIQKILL
ncbi:hypothetical protein M0812_07476 [Anaeramoeba flamelloides]|uniref:Uncharacterized protein n=1 Tax=Anaeramoeba flamelloides TaxID=1746091 RepID=A0AAV8A4S7_9EUKA|nr:hypothetical protein M0812_07476 [Anaeramoeba flamelloides]